MTTLTLQITLDDGEDFAWLARLLQHRQLAALFFEKEDAARLLTEAILGEFLEPKDMTEDTVELLRDYLSEQDDPMGESEELQRQHETLWGFLTLAEADLDEEETQEEVQEKASGRTDDADDEDDAESDYEDLN